MLAGRVIPLEDIKVGDKHYLLHRDTSQPQPHVNLYVKVVYVNDSVITLRKNSRESFIDYYDNSRYSYVTFKKHFYNKNWHLAK